jgi:hypothetical protein
MPPGPNVGISQCRRIQGIASVGAKVRPLATCISGRIGARAFYKTIRFLRKQSDHIGSVVKSISVKSDG